MTTPARKPVPSLLRRGKPAGRWTLAPPQKINTSYQVKASDWLESPYCNLPLRHPLWAKLKPDQRRSIWQGLAQFIAPKNTPAGTVAHIALENFHTDLPFSQRHDFLHTSLSVLLGEDFVSRMQAGVLVVPDGIDPFADGDILQTTQKDFWQSWQSYHRHELADYHRGVADAGQVQELAIEDVISYFVKRIPDGLNYRLECLPGYSDAYLEGLANKGHICWTSKLLPEILFSLFLTNNRLRRIIFGKQANANFSIRDVCLKFAQH